MSEESVPVCIGTIPSCAVESLRRLVGARIAGVIRYSWWPPEQAAEECGIADRDVFSLTAGPATFAFDSGMVLGVSSDPGLNSVCVWIEASSEDPSGESALSSDHELHPIAAGDPVYAKQVWREIVGGRIAAISILRRNYPAARFEALPNEVGLCFTTTSGVRIVASHGLHDGSDDLSVIEFGDIHEAIRPDLHETALE